MSNKEIQAKILIGTSWKMNKTNEEAISYIKELSEEKEIIENLSAVQVFVLPPFTAIKDVAESIKEANLPVLYGAQNVCWEDFGAYTGEVSAPMLKELDCYYVELNHQERRKYFNETNETVNAKIKQVLKYDMHPIICFGDEEKTDWDNTEKFLKQQLEELLIGVDKNKIENLVFAYEPRWAIGKKEAASVEVVDKVHSYCRDFLTKAYGADIASKVRILYGGSVTEHNAAALLQILDVDGLFIGRAALSAKGFVNIIKKAF